KGVEAEGEVVVKPSESSFFVETSRGVIMGDLSNIMFDKVEKINSRRISMEALTIFMTKGEKTNYIWIDTISDTSDISKLGKSVLWIDAPYIYTGVCR
ncbi:MAG: hypothetical protein ACU85E_16645, partial [Gammaproteobacteria bacterium]